MSWFKGLDFYHLLIYTELMGRLWEWVKTHKLVVALLVVIGYFLFERVVGVPLSAVISPKTASYGTVSTGSGGGNYGASFGSVSSGIDLPSFSRQEAAPQPQITDRMVVSESNLSLVVDDVRKRVDAVLDQTTKIGGYMVSSSLSSPEEAPFASVVIRVPSKSLKPMLEFLRSQAVKVSSENLTGTDVTDTFVDYEARLETLSRTKLKYEEIMARAVTVADIMQVQQQLISLQDQIDRVKGQMQYLEKTAENAKLTIYLSTDEWSLPYAPATPFRPAVIFKEAVRSLVLTVRGLVSKGIWIAVYSPIWLPVVGVIWYFRRRQRTKEVN